MTARYRWPLSPQQDRDVRVRVSKRLLERHNRNWDARDEEWPILERPSGREELAFYRSSDLAWWEQLAETYPDEARRRVRTWAALTKRYGPAVPVVGPTSNGNGYA